MDGGGVTSRPHAGGNHKAKVTIIRCNIVSGLTAKVPFLLLTPNIRIKMWFYAAGNAWQSLSTYIFIDPGWQLQRRYLCRVFTF